MLAEIAALVTLIVAGVYDLKAREIPEEVMYLGLIAVVTGFAADNAHLIVNPNSIPLFDIMFLLLTSIMVAVSYFVYRAGFYGEGDYYAMLIIGISNPFRTATCIFPLIYLVVLYYAFIMLMVSMVNVVLNLINGSIFREKLPLKYRLLYLFVARPMRIKDYIRKPGWWYPLGYCGNYRSSFDIYKNPEDEIKELMEIVSKGKCSSEIVWVTYGTPAVAYFAIAYILALLLGDKPVLGLLGLTTLCG